MKWIALVVVVLAFALATPGCANRNDPKDNVALALDKANIEHVNLDWDRDAHVLHLKGEVDSPDERTRAEQIASAALGPNGRVASELTVKGRPAEMADDLDRGIEERVKNLIDTDAAVHDRNIDVNVNNGVVTVDGRVKNASEKQRVEQLARQVPGVKDVVNSLRVES